MSYIKHAHHDEICAGNLAGASVGIPINVTLNLAELRCIVPGHDPRITVEAVVRKFLTGQNDRHLATRALMNMGISWRVADETLSNALAAFEAAQRRMGDAALTAYEVAR